MKRWIEQRVDRLANPMLVKEMYQSVHSKKFLAALWLLLVVSLSAYVIVYNSTHGGESGRAMFAVFGSLAYLMGVCVLPFLAFDNMREEVKGRTAELIDVTGLGAGRQVWGRLLASLVKVGLLYSVIAPFAVAAFLFKGIGLVTILLVLYVVLIGSMAACSVAILFGALTTIPKIRTLARIGFILLVLWALMMVMATGSIVMEVEWPPPGVSAGEFLGALAYITLLCGLGIWLICEAAANLITFEAAKSWGRTKIVLLLILALSLCVMFLMDVLTSGSLTGDEAIAMVAWVCIVSAICSLFWMTERTRVSRRTERKLERHDRLYGALLYPLTDGPASSAVFLLLLGGIAVGWVAFITGTGIVRYRSSMLTPVIVALVYALYLSALVIGAVRLMPPAWRTPTVRRVTLLVILLLNVVAAGAIEVGTIGGLGRVRSPLLTLLPLTHLISLGSRGRDPRWVHLLLPAFFALPLHAVVLVRHFRRYMREQFG